MRGSRKIDQAMSGTAPGLSIVFLLVVSAQRAPVFEMANGGM